MAAPWKAPPSPVADLPVCFFPGCRERASFGYGVTRTSEGRHFCFKHRPDPAVKCASDPEPIATDLFAPRRRAS